MASYQFPSDVGVIGSGHWILFEAFEPTGLIEQVASGSSAFNGAAKDIVFLFNPGGSQAPLVWQHEHEYEDVKLMRVAANFAGIGQSSTGGIIPNIFGTAINPRAEILYRNTNLRKFQLNFMMAPSSKKESESMKNIIKVFRARSAPTLMGNTYNNVFKNPCEWRIRFFFKGENGNFSENTNIPKIGKSVIERVDVDYTQNSEWSTFQDGSPVMSMITLMIREMPVIDSEAIEQRGY